MDPLADQTEFEAFAEFAPEPGIAPAIAFFRQLVKLQHLLRQIFDKENRSTLYLDNFSVVCSYRQRQLFSIPIVSPQDFEIVLTAMGDFAAQRHLTVKIPALQEPTVLAHLERLIVYHNELNKALEGKMGEIQVQFHSIIIQIPCQPQATYYAAKHGFRIDPNCLNYFAIQITQSSDYISIVRALKNFYDDLQKFTLYLT